MCRSTGVFVEFYKLPFHFEYNSSWEIWPTLETSQHKKSLSVTIARVPFKSFASQPTICLELAMACTQQSKFSNWSIIKMTAVTICIKNVFKLTKWKEQEAARHPIIILPIDMGHSVRKLTSHHLQKAIVAHCSFPLDPLNLNYVQKASFISGCFLSTHSMGSRLFNLFFNCGIK